MSGHCKALQTSVLCRRRERLDGSDITQGNDMDVFCQRFVRPGSKEVQGHPRDEAQSRIHDVHGPSIRQMDPKRDERVPVKFRGKCIRIHALKYMLRPPITASWWNIHMAIESG